MANPLAGSGYDRKRTRQVMTAPPSPEYDGLSWPGSSVRPVGAALWTKVASAHSTEEAERVAAILKGDEKLQQYIYREASNVRCPCCPCHPDESPCSMIALSQTYQCPACDDDVLYQCCAHVGCLRMRCRGCSRDMWPCGALLKPDSYNDNFQLKARQAGVAQEEMRDWRGPKGERVADRLPDGTWTPGLAHYPEGGGCGQPGRYDPPVAPPRVPDYRAMAWVSGMPMASWCPRGRTRLVMAKMASRDLACYSSPPSWCDGGGPCRWQETTPPQLRPLEDGPPPTWRWMCWCAGLRLLMDAEAYELRHARIKRAWDDR